MGQRWNRALELLEDLYSENVARVKQLEAERTVLNKLLSSQTSLNIDLAKKVETLEAESSELRNKVIEEVIQEMFGITMPNDIEYNIVQKLIALKK